MTQLKLPWTRPGVFYCWEEISLYCWEDVRPIAAAAISQPQGESLSKKPMWRKEHSLVKGNRATKQLFETTSCHIWRHILYTYRFSSNVSHKFPQPVWVGYSDNCTKDIGKKELADKYVSMYTFRLSIYHYNCLNSSMFLLLISYNYRVPVNGFLTPGPWLQLANVQ